MPAIRDVSFTPSLPRFYSMLVGAPLASSLKTELSSFSRTGALYRCTVDVSTESTSGCVELPYPQTDGRNIPYEHSCHLTLMCPWHVISYTLVCFRYPIRCFQRCGPAEGEQDWHVARREHKECGSRQICSGESLLSTYQLLSPSLKSSLFHVLATSRNKLS